MKPSDLSPDEEDRWRSAVGDRATLDVQSHAAYAEYPDSVANEQGVSLKTGLPRTTTTKLERGLKDVVITLPLDDRDRLLELIRRLRATGQWTSTADVVCDAVLALCDQLGVRSEP
jgi:hypothetical protein